MNIDHVSNFKAAIDRAFGRREPCEIDVDASFYHCKLAECAAYGDRHGVATINVVGAAAAFSPGFDPTYDSAGLDWIRSCGPDSVPGADNRPRSIPVPYGYAAWILAHGIYYGTISPWSSLLRNVKRGEYFRAILGDPSAFVIDVHCYRDLVGAPDRSDVKLAKLTLKQYRTIREAVLAAGIDSRAQAITWGDRRRAGKAHRNFREVAA